MRYAPVTIRRQPSSDLRDRELLSLVDCLQGDFTGLLLATENMTGQYVFCRVAVSGKYAVKHAGMLVLGYVDTLWLDKVQSANQPDVICNVGMAAGHFGIASGRHQPRVK